jgi:hypothetical protein
LRIDAGAVDAGLLLRAAKLFHAPLPPHALLSLDGPLTFQPSLPLGDLVLNPPRSIHLFAASIDIDRRA